MATISATTSRRGLAAGYGVYPFPDNTIAYLNWTGDWEDGPAPTSKIDAEFKAFVKILRKNKIKYRRTIEPTQNVYCLHVCILVSPEDREAASKLAFEHQESTTFFTAIRRDNA